MPDNGMTQEQADTFIDAIGTLDETLIHLTAATLLGAFQTYMTYLDDRQPGLTAQQRSEQFTATYAMMLKIAYGSFEHDFIARMDALVMARAMER